MTSTPAPKTVESNDALPASADERLAEAHKQITSVDEELTRLSSQLEKMEKDTARGPSAGPKLPSTGSYSPSAGPNLPSAVLGPQSPPGRLGLPVVAGLSLAGCVVIAVLALQWSYGEQSRAVVAPTPQLVLTAASPPNDPPLPAQSTPSPVPVTYAQTAPAQATPSSQTAPQDAAPPATSAIPDPTQLQAMARDLANAQRTIEQLRADQQQMARENARTLEELRASQEELKQALAKMSEQKTLPPPTQPASTQSAPAQPPLALRKPERPFQPPRARPRSRIPSGDWYYDEW
jgi:chemotaxis protein histidine kinase CheA